MRYTKIEEGIFSRRLNRFVAEIWVDGALQQVHVKNTGRCQELFVPETTVYVQDLGDNTGRKTRYDLIGVRKRVGEDTSGEASHMLINVDSQAPNKVVEEALRCKRLYLPGFEEELVKVKPEQRYGDSRLDLYVEGLTQQAFIEVKGVTLECGGIARFPDAPTERGIKHIRELIRARQEGFLSYIIFVIQMRPVLHFEPNYDTHAAFGEALHQAAQAGVRILAFDCEVLPDELRLDREVEVQLERNESMG